VTHLNLEWDLPWFTVKSVSAYQYLDHKQQENSSRSAFELIHAYDDVAAWNTKLYNYNEELDLVSNGDTNFDWITGVFLLSQKTQNNVAKFAFPNAVEFVCTAPPTPAQLLVFPGIENNPPSNLNFGQKVVSNRRSYSWFAQGTYHFTDDFRLVAGVRINRDEL